MYMYIQKIYKYAQIIDPIVAVIVLYKLLFVGSINRKKSKFLFYLHLFLLYCSFLLLRRSESLTYSSFLLSKEIFFFNISYKASLLATIPLIFIFLRKALLLLHI